MLVYFWNVSHEQTWFLKQTESNDYMHAELFFLCMHLRFFHFCSQPLFPLLLELAGLVEVIVFVSRCFFASDML